MKSLSVSRFPGFQRGHESTEIIINETECVRLLIDCSSKNSQGVRSSFKGAVELKRLLDEFSELDWPEIIEGSRRLFVDDADLYLFEGDFGRASFPLEYALDKEGLPEGFEKQCELLFKLVEKLCELPFEEDNLCNQ